MLFVAAFQEIMEVQYLKIPTSIINLLPVTLCPYKGKGKGHPCTGTEALYRPYGLYGE
jgi:hypothetical protein